MKIIGRMRREEDHPGHFESRGDLLVSMTSNEYEIWRTLTGPRADGDLVLDSTVAEAFQSFKYGARAAAEALGLIPAKAE